MESTARQRLTAQQSNEGTEFTNEKTPSGLEGGTLTNDSRNNGAAAGTGDLANPPLTKGRRYKEFKRRIRGKHVEHVPTFLESLMATATASCTYLYIFPDFSRCFLRPIIPESLGAPGGTPPPLRASNPTYGIPACIDLNIALIFMVMSWISHLIHWDERVTFVCEFPASPRLG
jgi:hypothetical protein